MSDKNKLIRHNSVGNDRQELPDTENLSPKELYQRTAGKFHWAGSNESKPIVPVPLRVVLVIGGIWGLLIWALAVLLGY